MTLRLIFYYITEILSLSAPNRRAPCVSLSHVCRHKGLMTNWPPPQYQIQRHKTSTICSSCSHSIPFGQGIQSQHQHGTPKRYVINVSRRKRRSSLPDQKKLEIVPVWAQRMPALKKEIEIPDGRGQVPKDEHDERVDKDMLRKVILTITLPVFFT